MIKKYLFVFFGLLSIIILNAQHVNMAIGTYTSGKSIGIYLYDFNISDGSFHPLDSIISSNPSFLAISPDHKYLYAANENHDHGHGGMVSSYAIINSHLSFLNAQRSVGDDPCYLTVDKTGKWLVVGNYSSGNLSVMPVLKDGTLGKAIDSVQDKGHGINKERQEAAHVHCTLLSFDNRYLFVPDLGIDKVMIYSFNQQNGNISPARQPYVKLKDGSGPRHLVFHPNNKWIYLAQEMGGLVSVFNYNNGRLTFQQSISALPPEYNGQATTADIHLSPDGKFLYVSNRDESNTIGIFSINQQNGILTLSGHTSVRGKTPRNFNIDPSGNFLLVANQNSDSIVIFKINHKTGSLTYTGKQILIGNPVCIRWIGK